MSASFTVARSYRWEALVASHPELTFVQLGSREESPIRGTVDMRGETSVRESVALLRHALAFVGVASFLAHATNATGTPAVVLFGPSAPNVWAHPKSNGHQQELALRTVHRHVGRSSVSVRCALSRRHFRCRSRRALRAQLTSSRIARTSSDAAVHAW
jgi:ADP-heptose:LPS heptosyltransferase